MTQLSVQWNVQQVRCRCGYQQNIIVSCTLKPKITCNNQIHILGKGNFEGSNVPIKIVVSLLQAISYL